MLNLQQESTYTIRDIPLIQIVPGDNDRTQYNQVKLEDLAQSIDENGLHQPITVRPLLADQFEIVAGHRRYFAVEMLGHETIPSIIRELGDEQAADVMWEENDLRQDLNPIEQAKAIRKRMEAHSYTVDEIAARIRRSPSFVRDRLALLNLAPDIQHLVGCGQLKIGYGLAMAELNVDRQRVALRKKDKCKTLKVFRQLCGELLAEQAQEAMFDWSDFMQGVIQQEEVVQERKQMRRFPINETLPKMRGAMTVGKAMEDYLAELLSSDNPAFHQAAAVVGRVYDGLLRSNLAHSPDQSRLDEIKQDCPSPHSQCGSTGQSQKQQVDCITKKEDEAITQVKQAEQIIAEIAELSEKLQERGVAVYRVEQWKREEPKQYLERKLRQWLTEHAPSYPEDKAIRMLGERYEKDDLLSRIFTDVVSEILQNYETVSREHITRLAMGSTGGWFNERIRPSKKCVRVRANIYNSYDGCPQLHGVIERIGALATFIGWTVGDHIDGLSQAVREAVEKKTLDKKCTVEVGSVKAFKFYKKGVLDLWFEDDETADQVAEALHPTKEAGKHHHFEQSWTETYQQCTVCGFARRNPRLTLKAAILQQAKKALYSQEQHSRYRSLPGGPREDAKEQQEKRSERAALAYSFYVKEED